MAGKLERLSMTLNGIEAELLRRQNAALRDALDVATGADEDAVEGFADDDGSDEGAADDVADDDPGDDDYDALSPDGEDE